MTRHDVVIVGAGLLGLATARSILTRLPGASLAVVDKEQHVATHQSGRNSGVIHSGLYYAPGSLKARLCVQGRLEMERFADDHGIPRKRTGKLVVATSESELAGLEQLRLRGEANGLEHIEVLDAAEIRAYEPNVTGIRALHVVETGIIDYTQVAAALATDAVAAGVELHLGEEVRDIQEDSSGAYVTTTARQLQARCVIVCAGLQSDRLAAWADPKLQHSERVIPFRGDYYTVAPHAREIVQGLVYPVPNPAFPFLGIHFTRRMDGALWLGPNAVLALDREGYKRSNVSLGDAADSLGFPGFWRLARKHWRVGAAEVWRDVAKRAFLAELRRFVPDLGPNDLEQGPSGIRAQLVRSDGTMVDDFAITETARVVHVRNAPSPAATASLAIGEHIADRAVTLMGY